MDDICCPRCKTTKYRNPSLKLMVNVCGHALCENCVELLFVRGSGSCPECGVALRRSNFRLQLFEDSTVEKEVDVRKKILRDFNKKEEDFRTLREYNDYLEMVETIIFNLSNNTDVEETRLKIEQYKRENQDLIKRNRAKLVPDPIGEDPFSIYICSPAETVRYLLYARRVLNKLDSFLFKNCFLSHDDEYLEMLIEQEQQESEFHRQVAAQEEMQAKKAKVKHKEALIDELMFSDLPANHILATHKRDVAEEEVINKVRAPTSFSTGIRMGKQDMFPSITKAVEGEMFVYEPLLLELCGPDIPSENILNGQGYMNHVRSATESELGGGFLASYACQRALQDAFCGLYFSSLSLDSVTNRGRQSMDVT